PRTSRLFPYTTLFRSYEDWGCGGSRHARPIRRGSFAARVSILSAPLGDHFPSRLVFPMSASVVNQRPPEPAPAVVPNGLASPVRSEEHTSELQSRENL